MPKVPVVKAKPEQFKHNDMLFRYYPANPTDNKLCHFGDDTEKVFFSIKSGKRRYITKCRIVHRVWHSPWNDLPYVVEFVVLPCNFRKFWGLVYGSK
jgi:hypothetical protein